MATVEISREHGAARLGGSDALAWVAQAAVALIAAGAVALVWRSDVAHEIKAATLGCGVALATPYLLCMRPCCARCAVGVFVPPWPRLWVLAARIGRHWRGVACLLVLIFPFVKAPVGFAAALIIAGLIARHALVRSNTRLADAGTAQPLLS
jgi:arabinofuranan 3-O-arabinosyltransferase